MITTTYSRLTTDNAKTIQLAPTAAGFELRLIYQRRFETPKLLLTERDLARLILGDSVYVDRWLRLERLDGELVIHKAGTFWDACPWADVLSLAHVAGAQGARKLKSLATTRKVMR